MFERFFISGGFDILSGALSFLYIFAPLWVPITLFFVFLNIWLKYRRIEFIIKQGSILLEIKLPKEVNKSPYAMELIFTALWLTGTNKNYYETFWLGKVRPWFSFEIVSIDGNVRFFIWTPKKFRQLIESQFYAQYPGVEIYEAEDYSRRVYHDPVNLPFWGTTFKLTKEDVYPIKTYIDYGLDKDPKEEYKIDPMTSILEFMGSIKKGEQVWIQIMIQAHRKESVKNDAKIFGAPSWEKEGKAVILKKINELRVELEDGGSRPRMPTKGEAETIAALERSLDKLPFDCGIRGFYIAKKESFDSIGITGLIGSFRQYNSQDLNGFKLGKFTDPDNPWQDILRIRRSRMERRLLNAYKLRSFFQIPYRHIFTKPFVLNTEELATIFHLPGQVAVTPTLSRAVSRKSEAPANLPV